MIYNTTAEHYAALMAAIDAGPKVACVATFGVYAGVAPSGHRRQDGSSKLVADFLSALETVQHSRILVGVTDYSPCKLSCLDCGAKYAQSVVRLLAHQEAFPKLTWRAATGTHCKFTFFIYDKKPPRAFVGGRNLTGSDWSDVTVQVDSAVAALGAQFSAEWARAEPIDSALADKLLQRAGVSPAAIDYLGS